jgi:hypothetical protein
MYNISARPIPGLPDAAYERKQVSASKEIHP